EQLPTIARAACVDGLARWIHARDPTRDRAPARGDVGARSGNGVVVAGGEDESDSRETTRDSNHGPPSSLATRHDRAPPSIDASLPGVRTRAKSCEPRGFTAAKVMDRGTIVLGETYSPDFSEPSGSGKNALASLSCVRRSS